MNTDNLGKLKISFSEMPLRSKGDKAWTKVTISDGISEHSTYYNGKEADAKKHLDSCELVRATVIRAMSMMDSDDAWFAAATILHDAGWIDRNWRATDLVESALGEEYISIISREYGDKYSFAACLYYCMDYGKIFSETWYASLIMYHYYVREDDFTVGYLWSELCHKRINEDVIKYGNESLDRQRTNAPKGAEATKALKELRLSIMRELAFEPDNLLKWIGKSDREKVRFLRQLAGRYDSSRSDEYIFQHNGHLLSPNWFGDLLSDWQASGDISAALNSLNITER